jgi:hypothetical protein
MEKQQENKKSNTNKILILIIAILTVFCGILVWQYIELNKAIKVEVAEKQEVTEHKDALQVDLENLRNDYESLETNNETLQEEINQNKDRIEQLIREVEKNKNNTALMVKYKKETETLRKIMQNYVVTIDSLNTLNISLRKENLEVKSELSAQQVKYQELNKEKSNLAQKVENASILTSINTFATGIQLKSGGKESETNRAKKTEKIKICFTLGENKIAPKGPKEVFVRILSPEGKVLAEGADENYMFSFEGVRGLFSAKRLVEYQNEVITGCAYYTLKQGEILPEGRYIADVYADKAKIGSVTFDLK